MNRRGLLGTGLFAAGGSLLGRTAEPSGIGGNLMLFNPRSFGATGDGKTLDTEGINRAIEACHGAGGGIVYLSPGIYLSGTVLLRSNVTLYLEAGATLLGSKSIADYRPQAGPHLLG